MQVMSSNFGCGFIESMYKMSLCIIKLDYAESYVGGEDNRMADSCTLKYQQFVFINDNSQNCMILTVAYY